MIYTAQSDRSCTRRIHVGVNAAKLKGHVGLYRSDSKRLILYEGFEPERSKMYMVHEAIQEGKDLASKKVKYKETDAFIAGAVAAVTVNKDTNVLEHPKAEKPAVELVLAGQAASEGMRLGLKLMLMW